MSQNRDDVDARATIRHILASLALVLLPVALWAATHHYKGLFGDAELYAVQAMARIRPGLAGDLFLRYGSQDKYTVFSPFYAWCAQLFGLRNAALALLVFFKIWLYAATWLLTRAVASARVASAALALLIIVSGTYGGFEVFRYADDFLTARSLAEALVLSSIALHFYDYRIAGLLMGVAALVVHPIMALPGLLILVCLHLSLRVNLIFGAAGILITLAMSFVARHAQARTGLLAVMDSMWLDVVRERSVFLFPELWTGSDWENTFRPFLALTVTWTVLRDTRIRQLCMAAMLVGATGVVIALVASVVGQIALLIQAQTWRWMWLTSFLSVLMVAPTIAVVYRDVRCGPLTAILLVLGWTFAPVHGAACIALSLCIWLVRERVDTHSAIYLRWAAVAVGVIVLAWIASDSWNIVFAPNLGSGDDFLAVARIRNILGLQISAFILSVLLIFRIHETRSLLILTIGLACIGGAVALFMRGALSDPMRNGAPKEILEFADWRKIVPPTSNVFVTSAHNSATFAWFTLERPSYLTLDQSAGVVFSRATSLEVKRRSLVLLPMLDPDWQLRTMIASLARSAPHPPPPAKPLTRKRLTSICADPELGFVIAKENVGFAPIPHHHVGDWNNWNLYDCDHVRSAAPPI